MGLVLEIELDRAKEVYEMRKVGESKFPVLDLHKSIPPMPITPYTPHFNGYTKALERMRAATKLKPQSTEQDERILLSNPFC